MAQAYRKLKKPDEAAAGFRRLIQIDPKDPKPYLNLGEISIDAGDFDAAVSHLEKAVAADPEHSAVAHNLLGSAYLEKKMLEPAEREIRTSLEMRPQMPDAHYNLGLLYEEKGDLRRAAEEYRKEIEIHPAAYPAYFNLGLLCAKTGDRQGEVEELQGSRQGQPQVREGTPLPGQSLSRPERKLRRSHPPRPQGTGIGTGGGIGAPGSLCPGRYLQPPGAHAEYRAELEKGQALEARIGKR